MNIKWEGKFQQGRVGVPAPLNISFRYFFRFPFFFFLLRSLIYGAIRIQQFPFFSFFYPVKLFCITRSSILSIASIPTPSRFTINNSFLIYVYIYIYDILINPWNDQF